VCSEERMHNLVGKPEGTRPLAEPRLSLEDNAKGNLKERECVGAETECTRLRTETRARMLSTCE
jgi:hypothetical protein